MSNWTEHYSQRLNRSYWYNSETKKSTWVRPESWIPPEPECPPEEEQGEYMSELIECAKCNCSVKRIDMAWRDYGYLDVCEKCDNENNGDNPQNFIVASGCIGKSFYENYIKKDVSKYAQSKFEAVLLDDEDFIEFYRVHIDNPADAGWQFSCLWFFDVALDSGFMPVFKSGVNTSSCLAMEMCGIDREEDEENTMTLEQLLEYAPNGSQKSKEEIKKILLLAKR